MDVGHCATARSQRSALSDANHSARHSQVDDDKHISLNPRELGADRLEPPMWTSNGKPENDRGDSRSCGAKMRACNMSWGWTWFF